MVLCCQLPPDSGNQRHIPDSSPHRYLTRILSHNHGHCMCFSEDMGSHKPLNVTFDTHRLNISVVLCCQLPPDSGNQRHIPDSSPHRYPTRILSHNHGHCVCICEDMGSLQPLNFTFIHRLNIAVGVWSQLPPTSGNHRDIPDTSPHRYLTRILSLNH